ncbi:MAG: DUF4412 domain-containing protein [Chlorobiaceae bacterium]|nr:DUF4412 domain-containing protein [Chlorobiaceae bacterium]NTV25156.1 DUF4412 domain-containing protein [Chlorobiaceae bacterium]
MKKPFSTLSILLLLLLALPSNAPAAFTGQMDMSLKMPNGTADILYLFGRNAQKMDMTARMDRIPEPLKTTVITRTSRPDEAIVINHRNRSWSPVNLRSAAESATLLDFDSNYRLTRLGTETIRGYQCEHIRLTSRTEQLELWMSQGLADFSTFRLLQSQNPRLSNTSLSRTIAKAGIEGFPVRIVQKNDNGLYVMDLRRVVPKTVAESSFSVPKGYVKADASQKPVDSKQKEHLRKLMEKMKDFEQ